MYIERSQFTQSSNELSVTLETSAGTTAMQAFIISGFQTGIVVTQALCSGRNSTKSGYILVLPSAKRMVWFATVERQKPSVK